MFAIVILSILGLLFRKNHPELVGGEEDPQNGEEVAATVFIAVLIYVVCSPLSERHERTMRIIANTSSLLPRGFWSFADVKVSYTYEIAGEAPLHYNHIMSRR